MGSVVAILGVITGAIAGTFLIPVPVIGYLIGACGGACLGACLLELGSGRKMEASAQKWRWCRGRPIYGHFDKTYAHYSDVANSCRCGFQGLTGRKSLSGFYRFKFGIDPFINVFDIAYCSTEVFLDALIIRERRKI